MPGLVDAQHRRLLITKLYVWWRFRASQLHQTRAPQCLLAGQQSDQSVSDSVACEPRSCRATEPRAGAKDAELGIPMPKDHRIFGPRLKTRPCVIPPLVPHDLHKPCVCVCGWVDVCSFFSPVFLAGWRGGGGERVDVFFYLDELAWLLQVLSIPASTWYCPPPKQSRQSLLARPVGMVRMVRMPPIGWALGRLWQAGELLFLITPGSPSLVALAALGVSKSLVRPQLSSRCRQISRGISRRAD